MFGAFLYNIDVHLSLINGGMSHFRDYHISSLG